MIRILVWVGVGAGIIAFLAIILNAFLMPNDLRFCAERPNEVENCQVADAVIAVSGGDTTARAQSAIELYKNGWANGIIFSGAAADPKSQSNAVAMRDLAVKSGVSKEAIVIDEKSKNTRENAANVAEILNKNNIKTVILTTSPYHMRRVLWEFERAAPEVEFRSRPSDDRYWNLWFIKPSGWWRVINEIGGLIVFGLRGLF